MTAGALNEKIDREAALRCKLARVRADELPVCLANEREATAKANTLNGALGECRQGDAQRVALAVELGKTQEQKRRRVPRWLVYVIAGAAALLGFGGGYVAGQVAK